MVKLRLRYVVEDTDRHGNHRYYFRRKGGGLPKTVKVRLPGLPGSKEFMEAYATALGGPHLASSKVVQNERGSFGFVCKSYYASATFAALNRSTQSWRRRVLDEICRGHGEKPIARMQATHVRNFRDEKANTPSASHSRLKALHALFQWATEGGLVTHDPTKGVKPLPNYSDGHHSWTFEEIAAFEERHPIGSKARLAMALMLYTACRRGDVIRLGPQHIRDGRLKYRQAKNENRRPVDMDIPVHEDLAIIIAGTPSEHLTFLTTEYGRPFAPAGFGNKFREWCNQAGLNNCSAHGLRKATAARLAQGGATPHEIMAITGHKSLKEVERYASGALKPRMADAGMSKFKR
jgi:integrase/recombinase XerD